MVREIPDAKCSGSSKRHAELRRLRRRAERKPVEGTELGRLLLGVRRSERCLLIQVRRLAGCIAIIGEPAADQIVHRFILFDILSHTVEETR